jgi:hypothetical protein
MFLYPGTPRRGGGTGGGGGAAAGINPHSVKMLMTPPLTRYLHFLSYQHVPVPGVHICKSFQNSVYNKTHILFCDK